MRFLFLFGKKQNSAEKANSTFYTNNLWRSSPFDHYKLWFYTPNVELIKML